MRDELPRALRLAQMMEPIQVASIAVRDRLILAAPARSEARRQSKGDVCRAATAEVRDAVKERIQPLSSCL